jgi:glycosyltransferase involved in cell wall biosynthesis
MKINILTRCTRIQNLEKIKDSIFIDRFDVDVNWHVIFDIDALKEISFQTLKLLDDVNITIHYHSLNGKKLDKSGGWHINLNEIISNLDGWVYILDDDNILHNNFYEELFKYFLLNKDKLVFLFNQYVGGKDFTGLTNRIIDMSNIKVRHIDTAQFIIHTDVFNKFGFKFGTGYCADGEFIESLYNNKPDFFYKIDKILCYYNFLESNRNPLMPRVLCIGSKLKNLKTNYSQDWEAKELDVLYIDNDDKIEQYINSFNPHGILTVSDNWKNFKKLSEMPLQVRNKWINTELESKNTGDEIYHSLMTNILERHSSQDLISFITPIFNTGNKLWNTYKSILNQTYKNWEWILVNDSTDNGITLKIAEEISKLDFRVKLYDFREKTGGYIGESKWRGFSMSSGQILAEVDHDDLLTPDCANYLIRAYKKYPDAGFYYTDCCEINENFESMTYPDGFSFGYSSYRDEIHNGIMLKVCNESNINPKTIRHIVGVPNHIRAWRRDVYFKIGGHNRDLPIADDYELIVRTFLETKFVKIPKLGYIQIIYNSGNSRNSHDIARADIQRRVKSISYFYNEKIKNRFEELGKKDWAYDENPDYPTEVASKFGESENYVNYIFEE